MKIKLDVDIDDEKIRGLLCDAFEGGSNYWYLVAKRILPPDTTLKDFGEGGCRQVGKSYWHWAELLPLEENGALIIESKNEDEVNGTKKWRLDRTAIEKGLVTMATKYPGQWANFMNEQDDGDTGDCFLQCCLFGEIVFA